MPVGYRRNDGHDTPAIIESMIRISCSVGCAARRGSEQRRLDRRDEAPGEREENRSSERMLDCRVGVSATVNDGLCRLYIGPCESQALIQQRDNGIPIMVFRLLLHGVEWARGKALRLLEFYASTDSKLERRDPPLRLIYSFIDCTSFVVCRQKSCHEREIGRESFSAGGMVNSNRPVCRKAAS